MVVVFWVGLVTGLLITMGFVNKQQEALLCKSLNVSVNQDDELYFLNKLDVIQLIEERGNVKGEGRCLHPGQQQKKSIYYRNFSILPYLSPTFDHN